MSATGVRTAGATQRAAWIVLVVLSALWLLTHVVGAFVSKATGIFVGLAIVDLAALVILLVPYRAGRTWAWWAVWVEVAVLASVLAWTPPAVGLWYLGAAVVLAAAQIVARPMFRSAG